MQINRVSFINIQSRQNKFTHEKQTTNQAQSKSIQIPATAHYPVFTGGYSLSLADTIKNLDKLAQKSLMFTRRKSENGQELFLKET